MGMPRRSIARVSPRHAVPKPPLMNGGNSQPSMSVLIFIVRSFLGKTSNRREACPRRSLTLLARVLSRRECSFSDVAEIDKIEIITYTCKVKSNVR